MNEILNQMELNVLKRNANYISIAFQDLVYDMIDRANLYLSEMRPNNKVQDIIFELEREELVRKISIYERGLQYYLDMLNKLNSGVELEKFEKELLLTFFEEGGN